MSWRVYVLGGKCPGGKCPGGKCPWGKCPGGTCPGGFCPVTMNCISCILCNILSKYIMFPYIRPPSPVATPLTRPLFQRTNSVSLSLICPHRRVLLYINEDK